jgi:hypothetical protein
MHIGVDGMVMYNDEAMHSLAIAARKQLTLDEEMVGVSPRTK